MKLKIAVVQMKVIQANVPANFVKIEDFILKAKGGQADVIAFPEYCITGIGIRFFDDFYVDDKHLLRDRFVVLAKKYQIDIVTGSFIEKDKRGTYNVSYYIDKNGEVRGKYKKINLWLPERAVLSSGDRTFVVNTRFGKAGIIICWDLMFPEIFRIMVRQGVRIIYCPSWWSFEDARAGLKYTRDAEINAVNALCPARAVENGIALIYCNAAGDVRIKKYNDTLVGRSQISLPFYGTVNRLDHNDEEMFIQEIDTSVLKDHERAYKIREDLRKRMIS